MNQLKITAMALAVAASLGVQAAAGAQDTIRYASMKDIRNINPHLYLGEMAAQAMVFEPLVTTAKDGTIHPALAESWDISTDGKNYTFHLRKGVKYTDGTPFDASSVKMNIDAIMANYKRHAWLDMINEIAGSEVIDEHTWRLDLKHPYFPTLIELSLARPFRMISPRCMKDGGTKDGVTCLAGTGPWKLTEQKNGQYALFTANESYWGPKPGVKAVNWRVLPDPQTMLFALTKGEIDLIFGADGDQLTSDGFDLLMRKGKLAVAESRPIASRAILLNSNAPITKDIRVREAIQRAINRKAIVAGVLNGRESVAETLFARSVPGCDIDLKVRPYDPAEAMRILDQAGWKANGKASRTKDGKPFVVTFYFNSKNAQERTIAEALQSDLRKVGIDMRIVGEEKQAFLDRQRTGEFDLQYSLSWGAPYDPQSYFSSWRIPAHGDFQAQIGLPDKKHIDDQVTKLMTEADAAKRQAITTDILTRIHDSAVYVPVSYSRTCAVHSKSLTNVQFATSQYEIPFELMRFEAKK